MKVAVSNRIIFILMHPVFISLLATVLIIILFIPPPEKYRLRVKDQIANANVQRVLYDDLDGNGFSDRIIASDYAKINDLASLLIRCHPFLSFNEWDFRGFFPEGSPDFIKTGDFDNDRHKEVYLFTISHDSAFLNILNDPSSKNSRLKKRFITKFKLVNGNPNINFFISGLTDMDNDSFRELVFSINSGFSLEPRSVFIYNIKTDALIISPHSGYFGVPDEISDVNGDGYKEIILNGYASQNVQDTVAYPVHDKCCWLIIYDHTLNYLFPPRKFPYTGYSSLQTITVNDKNGRNVMYSCYVPPESSGKPVTLYRLDPFGSFTGTCTIPGAHYGQIMRMVPIKKRNHQYLAIPISEDELNLYDTTLLLADKIRTKPGMINFEDTLDIDSDGMKEFISVNSSRNFITIFRNDLTHPVSIYIPGQGHPVSQVSLIIKPDTSPKLSLFDGKDEFILSYDLNPLYYARWAIYLSVFISIYLFTYLINQIQRNQIAKQQQREKKITELQLKIVRNQLDPHFTMNAINSVIDAVNRKEPDEAVRNLVHFSKMYRSLVLSADRFKTTLKEELEFTENYLALEKFRFREKIEYYIVIDPAVDTTIEIPKMIIQSPVENAVKHGLNTRSPGGKIEIHASVDKGVLLLMVEDNGIGRELASNISNGSTGKGIGIMQQFLELYFKITGKKITSTVEDLYDSMGSPSGTRVLIKVPLG